MTFLMMLSVVMLSMLIDTILYSKCDQASDLWQQLELASEIESDLRNTVDWDRKWLVWSDIDEILSFEMLGLTFSSKLDWGSYIISIVKTAFKKIGALIRSIKLLRLLSVSINLSYAHVSNAVITSRLMPVVATWNC